MIILQPLCDEDTMILCPKVTHHYPQLLYAIIEIFVRHSRNNHGTFARRSYEVRADVVLFPESQLSQIRGN